MGAYYRMKQKLTSRNADGKKTLYAQFAPTETVRMEEILEEIKERSALTSADVLSALRMCQDMIVHALLSGRNVELEGLGTFSAVLKHREVENAKEIRSESIRFRDVTFRTSPQLKRRLRGMKLTRVEEPKPASLPSEAERREQALAYLESHEHITQATYARINSCSRITASRELRRLEAEGRLVSRRFCTTLLYSLKNADGTQG